MQHWWDFSWESAYLIYPSTHLSISLSIYLQFDFEDSDQDEENGQITTLPGLLSECSLQNENKHQIMNVHQIEMFDTHFV